MSIDSAAPPLPPITTTAPQQLPEPQRDGHSWPATSEGHTSRVATRRRKPTQEWDVASRFLQGALRQPGLPSADASTEPTSSTPPPASLPPQLESPQASPFFLSRESTGRRSGGGATQQASSWGPWGNIAPAPPSEPPLPEDEASLFRAGMQRLAQWANSDETSQQQQQRLQDREREEDDDRTASR